MNSYTVEIDGHQITLNTDHLQQLDMVTVDPHTLHVLDKGRRYMVSLPATPTQKTFEVVVNGQPFQVKIEDQYDQLVEAMGLSIIQERKLSLVNAPMPGLVLEVLIKEGDQVGKGDSLIVLEAMKMENILKAEGSGTVKNILVDKGQAVDKGQGLIEFE